MHLAREEVDAYDAHQEEEEGEQSRHVTEIAQRAEEGLDDELERLDAVHHAEGAQHAHGTQHRIVAEAGQVLQPRGRHDDEIEDVPTIAKVIGRTERDQLRHHLRCKDVRVHVLDKRVQRRLGRANAGRRVQRALRRHRDARGDDDCEDEEVERRPRHQPVARLPQPAAAARRSDRVVLLQQRLQWLVIFAARWRDWQRMGRRAGLGRLLTGHAPRQVHQRL